MTPTPKIKPPRKVMSQPKKVYLAGPVFGCADPETWRNDVTAQLPKGWEAVNPLKIERFTSDTKDQARRIVTADLKAIDYCDAMLALIDDPSWGTAMEIFYADETCIPIIGWQPKFNGRPVSPWLQVHCALITSDFAEAMKFLKNKIKVQVDAEG
jgi:nucleoside 2-deoxyribosyltransferase